MEYTVNTYFNGIHWDSSYTDNMKEAEEWVEYLEDENISIWDRVNHELVTEFVNKFNILNEDEIKVTAEICYY